MYIYMGLLGLRIRIRRKKGSPQLRCLQHNPEVRDIGTHLKVDEEQWRIARGSKRQAGGV